MIVKPASVALNVLKENRDPNLLDIFFLSTLELFQVGTRLAEKAGQLENAHKCRLMCIDVHKLRIVAVKSVDKAAVDHAILFVNYLTTQYPSDGRFWFQQTIMQFNFKPEYNGVSHVPGNDNPPNNSSNSTTIGSFSSLCPLFRAILARDNPIDGITADLFLKSKKVDFNDTLLNLALKDFHDFIENQIETWSFLKYFTSFSEFSNFNNFEFVSFLLFIISFFLLSRNSFHLKIFFESILNSKNPQISNLWPFSILLILKISLKFQEKVSFDKNCPFEPSDAIWFKIFQLLKGEMIPNCASSLSSTTNFKSFFIGTILADNQTAYYSEYDFDEEFSIERDQIINEILQYFHYETGQFRKFITIRSDFTIRLGSHFCEKDTSSEEEQELRAIKSGSNRKKNILSKSPDQKHVDNQNGALSCETSEDIIKIDNSIQELKIKLANLSHNHRTVTQTPKEIDYLNNLFIIDTNVLLSGSSAIRSELSQRPERFLIPLIVIYELFKLHEAQHERASYAMEFIEPLMKTSLQVYNNYGRLLLPQEITQQLAMLSLIRNPTVNDDQIILLAKQCQENNPKNQAPILVTEDLNMRLKAKSKCIITISTKEFRQLCNC